jgi:hypothetical protein
MVYKGADNVISDNDIVVLFFKIRKFQTVYRKDFNI